MSMGYKASARLVEQDNTHALYQYYCCNLNDENSRRHESSFDGTIFVPISGKNNADMNNYSVCNASGTWKTDKDGYDIMSIMLLDKICGSYRKTGRFPGCVRYYS